MSNKHSKGPWSVFVPAGPGETFGIDCANANAVVFYGMTQNDGIPLKADADLIAAAPELLALVIRYRKEAILVHQQNMISDEADAVIAKATGMQV